MKKNISNHKIGNAGFTLPEVVVASFITVLAGIVLYSSMISARQMVTMAKKYTAAQGSAFDAVWEQYNRPYNEFENITASTNWTIEIPEITELDEDSVIRMAIYPPSTNKPYWEIHSNVVWSNYFHRAVATGYKARRYDTER